MIKPVFVSVIPPARTAFFPSLALLDRFPTYSNSVFPVAGIARSVPLLLEQCFSRCWHCSISSPPARTAFFPSPVLLDRFPTGSNSGFPVAGIARSVPHRLEQRFSRRWHCSIGSPPARTAFFPSLALLDRFPTGSNSGFLVAGIARSVP